MNKNRAPKKPAFVERHMGTKSIATWLAVCTCAVALTSASCAKATSTSPSTSSDPGTTTPSPTPTPTGSTATVNININPNPVPFSGTPITDTPQCANYAYTWFYDQVLTEYGGTDVKFT